MRLMETKGFTFSPEFKAYFSLSLRGLTNLLFHKGCQSSLPAQHCLILGGTVYGDAVVHSSQMNEYKLNSYENFCMFKGRVAFSMLNKTSAFNSGFQGLQSTEMTILIKNFQTIEH